MSGYKSEELTICVARENSTQYFSDLTLPLYAPLCRHAQLLEVISLFDHHLSLPSKPSEKADKRHYVKGRQIVWTLEAYKEWRTSCLELSFCWFCYWVGNETCLDESMEESYKFFWCWSSVGWQKSRVHVPATVSQGQFPALVKATYVQGASSDLANRLCHCVEEKDWEVIDA